MPDIVTYKCPACGAPLAFDADTQSWNCEYCSGTFTIEQLKQADLEAEQSQQAEPRDTREDQSENEEFNQSARAYSCPSCGAHIVTDENTAATFCMFCHNPTIISERLSGSLKPSKVIPFKFKKEQAIESFLKWSKKPLVPKQFRSKPQLEKITGMYTPFWLFDCDVTGCLNAKGLHVRSWTSGDMRYTETKHYAVSRTADMVFLSIPADGSCKMDDTLMDALEPYDYKEMTDFSMSYLSGHFAEKYDQDQKQVFPRIQKRVGSYTESQLRQTITGYDSVTVSDNRISYKKADADYTLLPLFMLTYKHKGKDYIFAMNGQTGKIAGKLPLSVPRALAFFSGMSALVFLILFIGGMFV